MGAAFLSARRKLIVIPLTEIIELQILKRHKGNASLQKATV